MLIWCDTLTYFFTVICLRYDTQVYLKADWWPVTRK